MQALRGYIEVGDGLEQCLFKGSLSHLLKCLWLGWKMESSIQWDHQENSEQWRSTHQIFLATNNRAPTCSILTHIWVLSEQMSASPLAEDMIIASPLHRHSLLGFEALSLLCALFSQFEVHNYRCIKTYASPLKQW